MKKIIVILLTVICSLGAYPQNSSKNIAIANAKALFIATANGDVAKIKKLTTTDFYREKYPYSDAKVREILLSVPLEKRKKAINQVRTQTKASAIMNRAGDVITVILDNQVTGKSFTMRLIEENGNWLVYEYDY